MVDVESLRRWLRFDTSDYVFPREVGKYRNVVNNLDEFLRWYNENKSSDFCWAGLYSMDQINKSCYDTLFLDFDIGKKGVIDIVNFNLFKNAISLFFNEFPRVRLYYSGLKGFHVYLDFGREIFFYNFMEAARKFVKHYIGSYILPDMSSVGDVRRMVRVVGNVRNIDGVERRMIELCKNDEVSKWMNYINKFEDAALCGCEFEINRNNDLGVKMLISIDEEIASKAHIDVDNRVLSRQSLEKIPPCIVNCFMELVNEGELNHGGRVLLANWLIWAGFRDDEVVDVFRVANDFKEHYTRYQVEFLVRKKYKLPSCKKIMTEGYCPYRCELYPWMQVGRDDCVECG